MQAERFFQIRYIDRDFSREELLDFTQDHIGRLTALNTAGEFDELLAATDTAYTTFGGTVGSELTAAAVSKAAPAPNKASSPSSAEPPAGSTARSTAASARTAPPPSNSSPAG